MRPPQSVFHETPVEGAHLEVAPGDGIAWVCGNLEARQKRGDDRVILDGGPGLV